MHKPDLKFHDVPSPRTGDLIRIILLIVGAILLAIGWYQWLK